MCPGSHILAYFCNDLLLPHRKARGGFQLKYLGKGVKNLKEFTKKERDVEREKGRKRERERGRCLKDTFLKKVAQKIWKIFKKIQFPVSREGIRRCKWERVEQESV